MSDWPSVRHRGRPDQSRKGEFPVTEIARTVLVEATPTSIDIDLAKTAVLVVDMQNDFGAKGGMFDRAGIDVSVIQRAVAPTAQVIASARAAGANRRPAAPIRKPPSGSRAGAPPNVLEPTDGARPPNPNNHLPRHSPVAAAFR